MYGTILVFTKFNNFGTRRLNGPRRLFHSFCCTTRRIFEPLHVYEPGFNTDKYGIPIHHHQLIYNQYLPTPAYPITLEQITASNFNITHQEQLCITIHFFQEQYQNGTTCHQTMQNPMIWTYSNVTYLPIMHKLTIIDNYINIIPRGVLLINNNR